MIVIMRNDTRKRILQNLKKFKADEEIYIFVTKNKLVFVSPTFYFSSFCKVLQDDKNHFFVYKYDDIYKAFDFEPLRFYFKVILRKDKIEVENFKSKSEFLKFRIQ